MVSADTPVAGESWPMRMMVGNSINPGVHSKVNRDQLRRNQARANLRRRNFAGVRAPGKAIPDGGNATIDEIANRPRHHEQRTRILPGRVEALRNAQRRIRATADPTGANEDA